MDFEFLIELCVQSFTRTSYGKKGDINYRVVLHIKVQCMLPQKHNMFHQAIYWYKRKFLIDSVKLNIPAVSIPIVLYIASTQKSKHINSMGHWNGLRNHISRERTHCLVWYTWMKQHGFRCKQKQKYWEEDKNELIQMSILGNVNILLILFK